MLKIHENSKKKVIDIFLYFFPYGCKTQNHKNINVYLHLMSSVHKLNYGLNELKNLSHKTERENTKKNLNNSEEIIPITEFILRKDISRNLRYF